MNIFGSGNFENIRKSRRGVLFFWKNKDYDWLLELYDFWIKKDFRYYLGLWMVRLFK